jgi:Spy/CpxP family protein refolding chaperone
MIAWWKHAHRRQACGEATGCGPRGGGGGGWGPGVWASHGRGDGGDFGASFGVRRPLRFLAYKLELEEAQVTELAKILDDLKTERAQAAVDDRRTTAVFADAVSADTFDDQAVAAAAAQRVKTAERLKDAVAAALKRIHGLLKPDQRAKLAYLIRTGALSI